MDGKSFDLIELGFLEEQVAISTWLAVHLWPILPNKKFGLLGFSQIAQ